MAGGHEELFRLRFLRVRTGCDGDPLGSWNEGIRFVCPGQSMVWAFPLGTSVSRRRRITFRSRSSPTKEKDKCKPGNEAKRPKHGSCKSQREDLEDEEGLRSDGGN